MQFVIDGSASYWAIMTLSVRKQVFNCSLVNGNKKLCANEWSGGGGGQRLLSSVRYPVNADLFDSVSGCYVSMFIRTPR